MEETNPVNAQRWHIGSLRRANEVLRQANIASNLSIGSIQALLLIAETPAQPISWVAREMQMTISGVQRVLLTLSTTDRLGRSGPGLIEEVQDPQRRNRKLILLSPKGRTVIEDVLTILTGQNAQYETTEIERLAEQQTIEPEKNKAIRLNACTPKQIGNAKRALLQQGRDIGKYIVSFPLRPAQPFIPEILEWLDKRGGQLYSVENVAKPDGIALIDFPDENQQFAFVMEFRQPLSSED